MNARLILLLEIYVVVSNVFCLSPEMHAALDGLTALSAVYPDVSRYEEDVRNLRLMYFAVTRIFVKLQSTVIAKYKAQIHMKRI